jgi:hypothetical protein
MARLHFNMQSLLPFPLKDKLEMCRSSRLQFPAGGADFRPIVDIRSKDETSRRRTTRTHQTSGPFSIGALPANDEIAR